MDAAGGLDKEPAFALGCAPGGEIATFCEQRIIRWNRLHCQQAALTRQ